MINYMLGDYKSAIDTGTKCIEIDVNQDSQKAEHYTTRAKIYLKLNNDENAIEDLKKALELDPGFEEVINY